MNKKKFSLWFHVVAYYFLMVVYAFMGLYYLFTFPMTGEVEVFYIAVSYFVFTAICGFFGYVNYQIVKEGYDNE